MKPFVDHLQLLPMPFLGGRRQPDGDHRPGGLGMATLADRLARRGWTARVEDMGYDAAVSESLLAEAFARGIGDGVLSALDRARFPIVLTRAGYGALGVIDALGPRTALVWVSAETDYRTRGLFGRRPLDRTALAMVTGRAARHKMAVRPARIAGRQLIVVGGRQAGRDELRAMAEDGVRRLAPDEIDRLPDLVAETGAPRWFLHIDLSALPAGAAPAADESAPEGIDPSILGRAIGRSFGRGAPLATLACARYDLNRDDGGKTATTLVDLIEAAVVAAGGVPGPGGGSDPGRIEEGRGEPSRSS
ncbi:MAG TPA: hypothetical protein VM737_07580 [Gemmatimonadota bacterium]|nr:hypothetical protein [Gemmatimonadota bacterium]